MDDQKNKWQLHPSIWIKYRYLIFHPKTRKREVNLIVRYSLQVLFDFHWEYLRVRWKEPVYFKPTRPFQTSSCSIELTVHH